MSRPPFLYFTSPGAPHPDALVLNVGKWTVPRYQTEAEGGEPEHHFVVMTHAQLMSFNSDSTVHFRIKGTLERNWDATEITESGSAATCAKRVQRLTGEHVTLAFDLNVACFVPKMHSLALASNYGNLGTSISAVAPEPQEDNMDVVDVISSYAICGSTGCTSGDLPNEDNSSTSVFSASVDFGGFESVSKDGSVYRYKFNFVAVVSHSADETVYALLYTGSYREELWGLIGAPIPLPSGFEMSDEQSAGSIRGIPVNCRYITYVHPQDESFSTGSEGNCPTPGYNSFDKTGEFRSTVEILSFS